MRRRRRYVSGGYFMPFAMVTVFAVATVASGIVIAAGQYRKSAARAEQDLIERVSLDSAVVAQADALVTGGPQPLAAHPGLNVAVNGRTVSVRVSAPQGKYDLNGDEPAAVQQGLAVYGVPSGLNERLSAALVTGRATPGASFESLRDLTAALGLSDGDEDCLRHWVTVGRWPGPMDLSGVGKAEDGAALRSIGPGDQADLRASLDRRGRGSGERVVWARLRFTGDAGDPWKAHDWRLLSVRQGAAGGEAAACP